MNKYNNLKKQHLKAVSIKQHLQLEDDNVNKKENKEGELKDYKKEKIQFLNLKVNGKKLN